MHDPAAEALRISRGFLPDALLHNTLDDHDIRDNFWCIFGAKQLLRAIEGEDHPLVGYMEDAQAALLDVSESAYRQAIESALALLPEHWEPEPQELKEPPDETTSAPPTTNFMSRLRRWLPSREQDHV